VLRFTNVDVLYRLDDVKDRIWKMTPPPLRGTSPIA
jgi:hypothetical protein